MHSGLDFRLGTCEGTYLVNVDCFLETREAVWIQVVRPYKDLLFTSRNGKGSDTGHDITDSFSRSEHLKNPVVLGTESGIPVDFRVVKMKGTVRLSDSDSQIWWPCQKFVLECPKFAVSTNFVDFIYHRPKLRILIQQDCRDEMFVWQILLSQIEMCLNSFSLDAGT